MASSEIMKLMLLLELKNQTRPGIASFINDLKKLDSQGKITLKTLDKIRNEFNKKLKFGGLTGDEKPLASLKKIDVQSAKTLAGLKKVQAQLNKELKTPAAPRNRQLTDGTPGQNLPQLRPTDDPQNRRHRRRDMYAEPPNAIERMSNFNDRFIQPWQQSSGVWRQQIDSLRDYTDETMKLYRAQERFKLIGLAPEENKKAFDAVDDAVKKFGNTTRSEGIETITDLHTAFAHLPDAIEALPMALKYKFSMQALYGDKFSSDQIESQIQNSFKFLELTGKVAKGRAEMEKSFDTLTKISSATGGRLTGADFLAMAKTGGASTRGLSTEGLRNMSAVMQEMGGMRSGTALMSLYQGLVGGHMPQKAAERFDYFGLLDKSKIEYGKAQQVKRLQPGANLLGDLMMEDPLKAADRLREAMAAKGVNVNDSNAVNKELATLIQNRTAQNLMSILMTQRGQVKKEAGLAEQAKGIESRGTPEEKAIENAKKFEIAMTNFKQQAGIPLVETLTKLANAAIPVMQFFGDHPTVTQWAMAVLLGGKAFSGLTQTVGAFTTAGSGVFSWFSRSKGQISSVAGEIDGLTGKVSRIPKVIEMGVKLVGLVAIEEEVRFAIDKIQEAVDAKTGAKTAIDKNTTGINSLLNDPNVPKAVKSRETYATAGMVFSTLNQDNDLLQSLGVAKPRGLGEFLVDHLKSSPFIPGRDQGWAKDIAPGIPGLIPGMPGIRYDVGVATKRFQTQAPQLANPDVMKAFLGLIPQRIPGKDDQSVQARSQLMQSLQSAFPESFKQATTDLNASLASVKEPASLFVQSLTGMNQPLSDTSGWFMQLGPSLQPLPKAFADTGDGLTRMIEPSSELPGKFQSIATSSDTLIGALDGASVKLGNWQPPAPGNTGTLAGNTGGPGSKRPLPSIPLMLGMPGRAVGGVVERDGVAYVHAGNVITPAKATKGVKGFDHLMDMARSRSERVSAAPAVFHVNYSPKITIHAADSSAKQDFSEILDQHLGVLEDRLTRIVDDRRKRA